MSDEPVGVVEGRTPVEQRPVTVLEADQSLPSAPRDGLAGSDEGVEALAQRIGRDLAEHPQITGSALSALADGRAGQHTPAGLRERVLTVIAGHVIAAAEPVIAARVRAEAVAEHRADLQHRVEVSTRYENDRRVALAERDEYHRNWQDAEKRIATTVAEAVAGGGRTERQEDGNGGWGHYEDGRPRQPNREGQIQRLTAEVARLIDERDNACAAIRRRDERISREVAEVARYRAAIEEADHQLDIAVAHGVSGFKKPTQDLIERVAELVRAPLAAALGDGE